MPTETSEPARYVVEFTETRTAYLAIEVDEGDEPVDVAAHRINDVELDVGRAVTQSYARRVDRVWRVGDPCPFRPVFGGGRICTRHYSTDGRDASATQCFAGREAEASVAV